MNKALSLVLLLLFLVSCGDVYKGKQDHLITPANAGRVMAEAIRWQNELDIVLYPMDLVPKTAYAFLEGNIDPEDSRAFARNFPDDAKDQFLVGMMRGRDVKEFVLKRTRGIFRKDLETSGLLYSIETKAGMITSNYFTRDNNLGFDDSQYYRVAISNYFFFSGQTFPSYKFRDGANFSFIPSGKVVSGKESLIPFLSSQIFKSINFQFPNARYTERYSDELVGSKKTYEIQGRSHLSPYWAKRVRTKGIVTAANTVSWYPGGFDVVIQDANGDGDPLTSDGVNIYFKNPLMDIEIGDILEVEGIVFEQFFDNGMSKTVIRKAKVVSVERPETIALPEPVLLGKGGRTIPDRVLSTFVGNVNNKLELTLSDGIDFWESLEGMRIKINNPRVVGFRGGKENRENEAERPQGYQTLYVVADGKEKKRDDTYNGGVMENFINRNFNPEIIQIADNHLSDGNMDSEVVYDIGLVIEGETTGVLSYETNLFGGGEFALVIPTRQVSLTKDAFIATCEKEVKLIKEDIITAQSRNGFLNKSECRSTYSYKMFCDEKRVEDASCDRQVTRITTTSQRPKTELKGEDNKLTVATFNLKNLSGNQEIRLRQVGETIRVNMNCPDIVNLVEIQDNNGIFVTGGADASLTLKRLITSTKCNDVDYQYVNVDPIMNGEGGQPGGNIRVAMIYNAKRVNFTPWGNPQALSATSISREGDLSTNPGRVFARADAFTNTRRSTVAQFEFLGKKIIVVGNHFNSKLGDSAHMGAHQPPEPESDRRRVPIATVVNDFVRELESKDPNAYIVVAGDFNAEYNEASMIRLMGSHLKNLMFEGSIVPANQRYTHNYNGSSAAIDFIFANRNLMKLNPKMDVLHVNSDYMGRVSDHDPLVAQFSFE